jgi:hypothetical protein
MTIFGYFECADLRLGTKTMRSFSALMIFLVGGCLLLRAILIFFEACADQNIERRRKTGESRHQTT